MLAETSATRPLPLSDIDGQHTADSGGGHLDILNGRDPVRP